MFKISLRTSVLMTCILLWGSAEAFGQGTAFSYQGRLDDSGSPASGAYDLQFQIFTALSGGAALGTVQLEDVQVTNGIFTVQLDFGAVNFNNSAAQFLEIGVRPGNQTGAYTPLIPRQPITSTPYTIRSLNAASADGLSVSCVNCVTSSQIQSVSGSAVSGAIPVGSVPMGSGSYIQNQNGSAQASSDFNISGNGTAGGTLSGNVVNATGATGQYHINGVRILSNVGTNNLFAGIDSGANNSGVANAFFGTFTGQANTSGISNSFIGSGAGSSNTIGNENAFFGASAGSNNTTGNRNSFLGSFAGFGNANGIGNTVIGRSANVGSGGLMNANAIGADAFVTQNNSLVLGSINGINGASANTNVGIGTTAPSQKLHVVGNSLFAGNLTVSGTFTGPIVNANTHYTIAGLRVLSVNGGFDDGSTIYTASNTFAGDSAGLNTTPSGFSDNPFGKFNSFFGAGAGKANTTGIGNSFFGVGAGEASTVAQYNSFFGFEAGLRNTSGSYNSFYGSFAGTNTTDNSQNAFFGFQAGLLNTGNGNAFFGSTTGLGNTTGQFNAFFGDSAGNNTTGSNNTFVGYRAGFLFNSSGDNNTALGSSAKVNSVLSNSTAIGAQAQVTQSSSLVLGSINGINSATADTKVGIGTTAPGAVLDVQRDGGTIPETARFTTYGTTNEILGRASGGNRAAPTNTPSGRAMLLIGAAGHDGTNFVNNPGASISFEANEAWSSTANGARIRFRTTENGTLSLVTRMSVNHDGNVGIGTTSPADLLHVNGIIRVATLGVSDTTTTLCRNSLNQIATCNASSLRYKTDVQPFAGGLEIVKRLRPITFTWKQGGARDVGFGAEDVAKVDPLFTFTNDKGEIEGVKYDRVGVVLVNAINEQQTQIDQQQAQIKTQGALIQQQQTLIDGLKKLICLDHPSANLCK